MAWARPLSAETPRSREASAVYPIEEGYVDAHGVMIYYTTVGTRASRC